MKLRIIKPLMTMFGSLPKGTVVELPFGENGQRWYDWAVAQTGYVEDAEPAAEPEAVQEPVEEESLAFAALEDLVGELYIQEEERDGEQEGAESCCDAEGESA